MSLAAGVSPPAEARRAVVNAGKAAGIKAALMAGSSEPTAEVGATIGAVAGAGDGDPVAGAGDGTAAVGAAALTVGVAAKAVAPLESSPPPHALSATAEKRQRSAMCRERFAFCSVDEKVILVVMSRMGALPVFGTVGLEQRVAAQFGFNRSRM